MPFDRFLIDINASYPHNCFIWRRCMSREWRIDSIDLTGKKFGKLTVIQVSKRSGKRGLSWKCLCDCGNKCEAYGGHLRSGERKSCGCLAESRIETTGVNRLMSYYKRKSSLKGREFALTFDQFKRLVQGICSYCGSAPMQKLKRLTSDKPQIYYNGIDRINSKEGYVLENCVTACRICNQSKSDLSLEQFKDHIKRISKWLSIDS